MRTWEPRSVNAAGWLVVAPDPTGAPPTRAPHAGCPAPSTCPRVLVTSRMSRECRRPVQQGGSRTGRPLPRRRPQDAPEPPSPRGAATPGRTRSGDAASSPLGGRKACGIRNTGAGRRCIAQPRPVAGDAPFFLPWSPTSRYRCSSPRGGAGWHLGAGGARVGPRVRMRLQGGSGPRRGLEKGGAPRRTSDNHLGDSGPGSGGRRVEDHSPDGCKPAVLHRPCRQPPPAAAPAPGQPRCPPCPGRQQAPRRVRLFARRRPCLQGREGRPGDWGWGFSRDEASPTCPRGASQRRKTAVATPGHVKGAPGGIALALANAAETATCRHPVLRPLSV